MKVKNKLLTLLILSAGAAGVTAVMNKCIKISAISKDLLSESNPLCYKWRLGNIHYTKTGTGKPLLLIHDLSSTSSSFEWHSVIGKLSETYTVYAIDMLGCGRSEKPAITYTNYLYVQLISDFVKTVIGHRTDIIATGASASVAIMACSNTPELFNQLMLVSPESILSSSQIPGKRSRFYRFIIDLPIVGTLIYNIATSKSSLEEQFKNKYFSNPYFIKGQTLDSYYEAAHLGQSPKSIFASEQCNYLKCNIVNALKKIDNSLYLVGGSDTQFISEVFNEYTMYNSAIESMIIPDSKHLPQLEKAGEFIKTVRTYFNQ